jgi:hypothetical protein
MRKSGGAYKTEGTPQKQSVEWLATVLADLGAHVAHHGDGHDAA